jgi:hypothetical protein
VEGLLVLVSERRNNRRENRADRKMEERESGDGGKVKGGNLLHIETSQTTRRQKIEQKRDDKQQIERERVSGGEGESTTIF